MHVIDRRGRGGSGDARFLRAGSSRSKTCSRSSPRSVVRQICSAIRRARYSRFGRPNERRRTWAAWCSMSRRCSSTRTTRSRPTSRSGSTRSWRRKTRMGRWRRSSVKDRARRSRRSGRLRSHGSVWPRMLALVHTIPYDARVVRDFDMDLRRLADMRTPTLMLIGGDSPPRVRQGLRGHRPRAPGRPDRRTPRSGAPSPAPRARRVRRCRRPVPDR